MRLAALAAILCLSLPALYAQEAPSPGASPMSDAPGQAPLSDDPVATIKVDVNIVPVFFSVRDKNGFITNLHKDDCSVTEDKVPQTIKSFTQEKNLPLTIGILLDTSGSQKNVLPLEQQSRTAVFFPISPMGSYPLKCVCGEWGGQVKREWGG